MVAIGLLIRLTALLNCLEDPALKRMSGKHHEQRSMLHLKDVFRLLEPLDERRPEFPWW